MASLPELEAALKNADAAGDAASARVLADEIVKMRSAAPQGVTGERRLCRVLPARRTPSALRGPGPRAGDCERGGPSFDAPHHRAWRHRAGWPRGRPADLEASAMTEAEILQSLVKRLGFPCSFILSAWPGRIGFQKHRGPTL